MASGSSSYASPVNVDPALGPYYAHPSNGNHPHHHHQDVADDLALRAELSRSLGLNHSTHESANTSHHQSPQPSDHLQSHQPTPPQLRQSTQPPPSPSLHPVNAGPLTEHQPSPPLSQHASDNNNNKDKRVKVSRACDECRRKKIRCDALTEQETCTNCKRSNLSCAFSRLPMKRGPSKGYVLVGHIQAAS